MRPGRYSDDDGDLSAQNATDLGPNTDADPTVRIAAEPIPEPSAGWIGGYHLLEPIGSGGSGTVWRAADEGGDIVALKLIHPSLALNDSARRRLVRETRLVNSIRGEGIARVLDMEIDALNPFVVTELIDGPTLEHSVQPPSVDDVDNRGPVGSNGAQTGPFTVDELAALAANLGEIIKRVHDAGIAHRDLKPSNIILSDDGPFLIDFGIAQGEGDSRLTTTGALQGTPGYVSPELLTASAPEADDWKRGDWFAWAGVLCFAATGRHPFGSGNTEAVLNRVFKGEVDVEGLSPQLARAFLSALAPDASQRLGPRELIQVLEEATWDDGIETTRFVSPPVGVRSVTPSETDSTQLLDRTTRLETELARTPEPFGPTPFSWETVVAPTGFPQPGATWSNDGVIRNSVMPAPAQTPALPGGASFGEAVSPLPGWMENLRYQHPRPRPAGVLSVLLLGVFVWAGVLAGPVGLLAPLALLLVAGFAGRIEEGVARRREANNGPKASDRAVVVASSPWHLAVSMVALLPGVVAALATFILVGSLGEVLVQSSQALPADPLAFWRWITQAAGATPPNALLVGGSAWIATIVAWALPSSIWIREGMSRWFALVAPSRSVRLIWSLVLAGAIVALIAAVFAYGTGSFT